MFTIDEFRKLLNISNKKLYAPGLFGTVCNFEKIHTMISGHCNFENMLAIIVFGSFPHKKEPGDIDIFVVMNNNIKLNDNLIAKRSDIEYYDHQVGWEEAEWTGSMYFPAGPVYETRTRGEWNPLPIDIL